MKPLPTMMGTMILVEAVEEDDDTYGSDDSVHPGSALSKNLHESIGEYRDNWQQISGNWRRLILFSLGGGFVIGVLAGLLAHRLSVMYMSCGWGGLLTLAAAAGLFKSDSLDGPWDSGMAMMLAWTAISATGLAIQSIFRDKHAGDHQVR